MKLYSKIFTAAILFVLSACESSVITPIPVNDQITTLEYSGGLNVSFITGVHEFSKSVRVTHQGNNTYILDIQMNVRTINNSRRENAIMQLDIPFNSADGIFPVCNYIINGEDLKIALGEYELIKSNGDFAQYNFKAINASLVVEESTTEKIKGCFILNLEQLHGKRMIDGQLEDVMLNSPIELKSHFDLEY